MQYTLALQTMFSAVLALAALVLYSSSQTQNYDLECLWCGNVIYKARDHFGDNIANTTNLQFEEYFDRTCRLDRRKSPLYGAICYDMSKNHRETLFPDLRKNASIIDTCQHCGFCSTV